MKYTYVSTDGSKCDIVTVSKDLLKNCTMTAQAFDEVFFDELRTSVTHMEAYEKAENFHYTYFEKRRYSSFEAFKQIQYRNHKKK
jgi:peptide methionine sulfoxide reductase MsrA